MSATNQIPCPSRRCDLERIEDSSVAQASMPVLLGLSLPTARIYNPFASSHESQITDNPLQSRYTLS
jgi:hypothetical protein